MAKNLRQIDDEALERPFDKSQFVRLLTYMKPYTGKVALALVLMVAVGLITLIADYIVFGTLTTVCVVPVYQGIINHSLMVALILAAASAVILWKHWENLRRIAAGTEIGLRGTLSKKHRIKNEKA